MELVAIRSELEHRRSPLRVVLLAVLLERVRVVLHVHARRNEVLVYELSHPLIRPHLGIQPSTAASHRRRAEIEKHGLAVHLRFSQDVVYIVAKVYWH